MKRFPVRQPRVSVKSEFFSFWKQLVHRTRVLATDTPKLLVASDKAEDESYFYQAWLLRSRADVFSQGLLAGHPATNAIYWASGLGINASAGDLLNGLSAPRRDEEVSLDLIAQQLVAVATYPFVFDGKEWRPRAGEEFKPWK